MPDWSTTLWEHDWVLAQWTVACTIAVLASVIDVRTHRIPNWLTGPAFLLGLLWAFGVGGGAGVADALVGCFVMSLPFFILFAFAGGGAGDVKLAMIGLTVVLVSGGFMAVLVMVGRRQARLAATNFALILMGMRDAAFARSRGDGPMLPPAASLCVMPYGLAIGVGMLVATLGVLRWHSII